MREQQPDPGTPRLGETWVGVRHDHPWTVVVNRVQERHVGFRVVGAGGKSRRRLLTMHRDLFLTAYRRKA